MRKLILLAIITAKIALATMAQCTSLFSYTASYDTVTFINQSSIFNAHYFWNFGDGTGSNFINPIHTFPGTGDYLVTLFSDDTVTNCSSYDEYWINVTKYSTDFCQPTISDSIQSEPGDDNLYVFNTSPNCNSDIIQYSGGPNSNYSPSMIMDFSSWQTVGFRLVCFAKYYDNNWVLKSAAFKSAYHNYSSSHNYGDCSANFEFTVVSKNSSGERILFKAMNKSATFYKWNIYGIFNTVDSNYDTISCFFPLGSNYVLNEDWMAGLMIQGPNGCRDTIYQNILVYDSTNTTAGTTGINDIIAKSEELSVFPNPTEQKITVQFNVEQHENVEYELYNLMGECVYTDKVNSKEGTISKEISLSSLSFGTYILKVTAGNNVYHREVIKLQ